jgi:hypothetical protein
MALHLLQTQAMLRPAVILTAGNTPSPGTGGDLCLPARHVRRSFYKV